MNRFGTGAGTGCCLIWSVSNRFAHICGDDSRMMRFEVSLAWKREERRGHAVGDCFFIESWDAYDVQFSVDWTIQIWFD